MLPRFPFFEEKSGGNSWTRQLPIFVCPTGGVRAPFGERIRPMILV
jgi:hypothetical protein